MSVFITGASSGIGEACARAFAQAGFDLILAARRKGRLDNLVRELTARHSVQVEAFELDVRSLKSVQDMVQQNASLFNGVKVLINNAGLARGREPFQENRPEDWDAMIDTNLKGLLYVTRTLVPGFIARGEGHIVNLGSVAGHWTYPSGAVYSATKFATRALTESLRLDLHGTGVRVTEISPGMVETEFSEVRFGGDKAKAMQVYEGFKPLSAADIAETILWCVQRPQHVNVQELVIYPTAQASVSLVKRN